MVPPSVQGRTSTCFACGARVVAPTQPGMSQADENAFKRGDRIADRYIIIEQIGRGGMGSVYSARDLLMDENVALKFMNPVLLRRPSAQRRFVQEAQIARRLRHENIVAVHDVTTTDSGLLYLSMEYLTGHPLRGFLRRQRLDRRYTDVRLAVEFISQILSALAYAHRAVIHRDLKPENVMVMPSERIKVLDFGLAIETDDQVERTPSSQGQKRHIAGTEAYAAPEQKRHETLDARADLYAVGLLFYELLTLRTPLDPPAAVTDLREDVSPALLTVLGRALKEEKEHRWPSASEFRQALLQAFHESYRAVSAPEAKSGGKAVSTQGMVYLEGGHFLMGCSEVREEAPETEHFVEPFYIDKYPVTVSQYALYLQATGASKPKFWQHPDYDGPDQPVVGVSWMEACAYAAWAGKQLPTEKQWEFAARGREGRRHPWGNLEPDTTRCNFRDYLGMPSIVTMHEDGRTPDNVCDLAGNVYEWTADPFVPYYRQGMPKASVPSTPRRAVRGGCFTSDAFELRCTFRKGLFPETQAPTLGFRCMVPANRTKTGNEKG